MEEIKKILQTLKIQDERIDELILKGLTDNLIHNTKLILSSESSTPPFPRDNTPTSERIATSKKLALQYNGAYNYMTIGEYYKVVQHIKRNLVGGRKRRSRAKGTNKKRKSKKNKSKKNKSKKNKSNRRRR